MGYVLLDRQDSRLHLLYRIGHRCEVQENLNELAW